MNNFRKISSLLILAAIIFTVWVDVIDIDFKAATSVLDITWLIVWPITPYIFLLALCRKTNYSKSQLKALLFGSVIVSLFGVVIFTDSIFIHPDAQSGLTFLFVPIYQWAGCGIVGFTMLIIKKDAKQV